MGGSDDEGGSYVTGLGCVVLQWCEGGFAGIRVVLVKGHLTLGGLLINGVSGFGGLGGEMGWSGLLFLGLLFWAFLNKRVVWFNVISQGPKE